MQQPATKWEVPSWFFCLHFGSLNVLLFWPCEPLEPLDFAKIAGKIHHLDLSHRVSTLNFMIIIFPFRVLEPR